MKIAHISIGDYVECVEGMPYDAERLFFRILLKIYSIERGIPNDDKDNARMFGYTPKTFRKLLDVLLEWPSLGLFIDDGFIKDARAEKEISKHKNWQKKSKKKSKNSEEKTEKKSKNSSEMQQQPSEKTTTYEKQLPSPTPTPSPEESNNHHYQEVSQSRPFNGSTEFVVGIVAGWMHGGGDDIERARNWLLDLVAATDSNSVKHAVTATEKEIAGGKMIMQPLKYVTTFAHRQHGRNKAIAEQSQTRHPKQKPSLLAERAKRRQKVEEVAHG